MSVKNKIQQKLSDADRELFLSFVNRSADDHTTQHFDDSLPPVQKAHAAKKKKKGVFDAILDLHGATRHSAYAQVKQFLAESTDSHFRYVLIIHGKGTGALHDEVQKFLEHESTVKSYCYAPIRFGGHGATKVTLK